MPPTPMGSISSKCARVRPRMLPLTPDSPVGRVWLPELLDRAAGAGFLEMMVGASSSGPTALRR